MNYYLIIDTETFGLASNTCISFNNEDNWPPIRQIAWQIYDLNQQFVKEENYIINQADLDLKSKHNLYLKQLNEDFKTYHPILVGHNIDFDKKVIGADFKRRGLFNSLIELDSICTMQSAVYYCDLPNYKFPALQELHSKLFNKKFPGAHQAINDVKATASCFFELKKLGVELNPEKDSLSNYPDYESYISELRRNNKLQITKIHATLELLRLFRHSPYGLNAEDELDFIEKNFYNHELNSFVDDSSLSKSQAKFYKYQEEQLLRFFGLTEANEKFTNVSKQKGIKPLLGTSLWIKSRMNSPKSKKDYYEISKEFNMLLIYYKHWLNTIKLDSSRQPNELLATYNELLELMLKKAKTNSINYSELDKVLYVSFEVYLQEGKQIDINRYLEITFKIIDEIKPNLEQVRKLMFTQLFSEIKNKIPSQHKIKVDEIITNLNKEEGGCFIATMCYGSYSCQEVITFREFRDNILSNSVLGRLFINFYYKISPLLVRKVKDKYTLVKIIRNFVLEPIRKIIKAHNTLA